MRFQVRLWFSDYNGNEAYTSLNVFGATTFLQLITAATQYAAVLSSISTAFLTRAEISGTAFTRSPIQAGATSDVDRRLLVVFTSGQRYATLAIPSGIVSDLAATGKGAGYRVAPGPNPTQDAIAQLSAALSGAVSPDGLQWPNARTVAAILKNPVG